jgi:hypothetical protein
LYIIIFPQNDSKAVLNNVSGDFPRHSLIIHRQASSTSADTNGRILRVNPIGEASCGDEWEVKHIFVDGILQAYILTPHCPNMGAAAKSRDRCDGIFIIEKNRWKLSRLGDRYCRFNFVYMI